MIRLDHNGIYKALSRAGDGVLVADANGRVLLWNRSAERVLGWGAAEAVGRTCCELFESRHQDGGACEATCAMSAARQGTSVESFDMRARTKAGREVRLNVSTLAVPADMGATPLVIHLFRDITSRPAVPVNGSAPAHGTNGNGAGSLGAPANGAASNRVAGEAHASGAESNGSLTPRELEVLRLLAGGANTRVAADQLRVSPATIRNHVQNLLGKLGVHSRLQAVAYANAHGLL